MQLYTKNMTPAQRQAWWRKQARIDAKAGGRPTKMSAYLKGSQKIRHAPESTRKGTPSVATEWYKQAGFARG